MNVDPRHLLSIALKASEIAAADAKNLANVEINTKEDGSLVTSTDIAIDKYITASLAAAYPGVRVVSEEDPRSHVVPDGCSEAFFIDPIDGTSSFAKGGKEYTVNIGLVRDFTPVFGVIVVPAIGIAYYTLPEGAFIMDLASGVSSEIGCAVFTQQNVHLVTPRRNLEIQHATELLQSSGFNIVENTQKASSWKLCMVAAGEANLYMKFLPMKQWDIAAGHAIIKRAGGDLVRSDLSSFEYLKDPDFSTGPFVCHGILGDTSISLLGN